MQEKGVMELLLRQRNVRQIVSREVVLNWSPLHCAAQNGYEALTRLPGETGAEIDAADQLNYTALRIAISNLHLDITQFLIENGTYLYGEWSVRNALYITIGTSDDAFVNMLLENDAK